MKPLSLVATKTDLKAETEHFALVHVQRQGHVDAPRGYHIITPLLYKGALKMNGKVTVYYCNAPTEKSDMQKCYLQSLV